MSTNFSHGGSRSNYSGAGTGGSPKKQFNLIQIVGKNNLSVSFPKKMSGFISTISSTVAFALLLWSVSYNPNVVGTGWLAWLLGVFVVSAAGVFCYVVDFVLISKKFKTAISILTAFYLYKTIDALATLIMVLFLGMGILGIGFSGYTSFRGGKISGSYVSGLNKPTLVFSEISDIRGKYSEATDKLTKPLEAQLSAIKADEKAAVTKKLGTELAKLYYKGTDWGRAEASKMGVEKVEATYEAKRQKIEKEIEAIRQKTTADLSKDEQAVTNIVQGKNKQNAFAGETSENILFYVSFFSLCILVGCTVIEGVLEPTNDFYTRPKN